MAKSKRSKVKQANRAVAKETLKERELERLKATCLSLHRVAGFCQSFSTTPGKRKKIEHGGFEPITTYVPTPKRPQKFAVHQLENGRYIQKDPSVTRMEEETPVSHSFYHDITKSTEKASSQGTMEVAYTRASETRPNHHHKRISKHRRNKHIRRKAF